MSDQKSYVYVRSSAAPTLASQVGAFTPLLASKYGSVFSSAISAATGDILTTGTTGSDTESGLPVAVANALLQGRRFDNGTNVPITASDATVPLFGIDANSNALLTESICMGFDTTAAKYFTAGIFTGGDNQVANEKQLQVAAIGYVYDGATLDLTRSGSAANLAAQSGLGAVVATPPGEWGVSHTPAAATQATIGRTAVGATRHVCKSITVTLIGLAAAAEATILVNLRDDATGTGTILWSARLLVTGTTGSETGVTLSNLNIVGSVNKAMTLEFATAGGANTFQSVAMTGYDAS